LRRILLSLLALLPLWLAALPLSVRAISIRHPLTSAASRVPAADLPSFDARTSLLVVAPHPDDEVLCCAGLIQRVLHAGGRVAIVWITSGDASDMDRLVIEKSLFVRPGKLRDLAARRTAEAHAAATILGIPAADQILLGYPDRGVRALLTDYYSTAYYSRYNGSSTVPYADALSPGHPYTGVSLERDFNTVLDRVKPTLVLAPSPRDAHTDHQAAGILVMRAMTRRAQMDNVRYWIVHGGETWPLLRGYHPNVRETPSPRSRGLSSGAFALTPAETDRKLEALRAYRTQMKVMSSFLLSYVRATELYSTTPMPPPQQQRSLQLQQQQRAPGADQPPVQDAPGGEPALPAATPENEPPE